MLHVAADFLDDLLRRERLAEQFDGPLPPGFGDHVSPRTQFLAQFAKQVLGGVLGTVDSGDVEGHFEFSVFSVQFSAP
jgi:hypothetical protein